MIRKLLFVAVVGCLLTLTACDVSDVFGGGSDGQPSDAVQVIEGVKPFVPNGVPRLILDLVLLGATFMSQRLARKGAQKDYDAAEDADYDLEEAKSMRSALLALAEAEAKDKQDAEALAEVTSK